MEQRVPGNAADLGRAVHRAAGPEAVQPAHRSRSSAPTSRRTPTTTGSLDNDYLVLSPTAIVDASSSKTFSEFPPRQKAASFTIDQAVEKLEAVAHRRAAESTMAGPQRRHVWISGGHVPDGLRRALSGGGARAPRRGRTAFWIDRCAGDQRASSPSSSRPPGTSRSPSGRSTPRTSRARRPRTSCPGRSSSPDARPGRPAPPAAVVDVDAGRLLEPPGRAGQRRSTAASDHPVVHVAYEDAEAYAGWAGQGAADRGRVGVRGARRTRRSHLHVGR